MTTTRKQIAAYSQQLGEAIVSQDTARMVQLLRQGADPNACMLDNNENYEEPLIIFAGWGCNLDVIKCLAKAGADLEAADAFGRRVLELVALNPKGSTAVSHLLAAGMTPNANTTVCAAYSGCVETMKILLDAGSNLRETGLIDNVALYKHPLRHAVDGQRLEMVSFLCKKGADLVACQADGEGAAILLAAVGENWQEGVEALIEGSGGMGRPEMAGIVDQAIALGRATPACGPVLAWMQAKMLEAGQTGPLSPRSKPRI